jgi:hypothetical protein
VFERRFAEIVVLDHKALVARIAYAINNPVEANLVRSHRDWTGLCLFSGVEKKRHHFSSLDERRYERALDTGADIDPAEFFETAELVIADVDAGLALEIKDAIEAREAQLRSKKTSVLGIKRVLAHSPFDRPQMSDRSAMPLCFGSSREVRGLFIEGWRAFVAAFRKASRDFRAGLLAARFPMYSFRPGTPAIHSSG